MARQDLEETHQRANQARELENRLPQLVGEVEALERRKDAVTEEIADLEVQHAERDRLAEMVNSMEGILRGMQATEVELSTRISALVARRDAVAVAITDLEEKQAERDRLRSEIGILEGILKKLHAEEVELRVRIEPSEGQPEELKSHQNKIHTGNQSDLSVEAIHD